MRFFTDTLRLRSLARLDIARELRDAIANGDIGLRYTGRHELRTGRLVTWIGYLRWLHPLRGEIRPVEFLKVAEATGLATLLSRAALAGLRQDFASARIRLGRRTCASPSVPCDITCCTRNSSPTSWRFSTAGGVPPERLELRIAEKTFIARPPTDLRRAGPTRGAAGHR